LIIVDKDIYEIHLSEVNQRVRADGGALMNSRAVVENRYRSGPHRSGRSSERRQPITFYKSWDAISRAFKAFAEGVAEARRLSRAYEELAAMSDPELHDMGINRVDIPAIVAGTGWCKVEAPDPAMTRKIDVLPHRAAAKISPIR
jgi:uncharacterized protein YjiS (DUF1127 family)